MMQSRFAAALTSRGVVQVRGADALRFLQGLVTNDVHALCGPGGPRASACAFLNGRGRVLFGAMMHRAGENEYLLDVEGGRVPALVKHLQMYKLRASVEITDVSAERAVWAVMGAGGADVVGRQIGEAGVVFEDPRVAELGLRAVVGGGFEGFDLPQGEEGEYTRRRILHGVPDGADFDGQPLPLDLGLHLLNGVSFEKGCYLGQELTARSHFTGVLRKRVTPVAVVGGGSESGGERVGEHGEAAEWIVSGEAELALAPGTEVHAHGDDVQKTTTKKKKRKAGVVSSAIDNMGLAVLRLTDVFPGGGGAEWGAVQLSDGRACVAWRPGWWGLDAGDGR